MEKEKQTEIEELCKRIRDLASSDHLTEEEKLTFARKALEIIENESKELVAQ